MIANSKINSAARYGGALYATVTSQLTSINNSTFVSNEAGSDGGAIYCFGYPHAGTIQVRNGSAISNFVENGNGGFVYLSKCRFSVVIDEYTISNNRAQNGGAVYAERESFIDISNAVIVNNTAGSCGGALYLTNSSVQLTGYSSDTIIDHNVAVNKGGAIFVGDEKCEEVTYPSECFIKDYSDRKKVIFTNNSASQGPILHGGLLDRCFTDFFNNGMALNS